jgi:hypothetical protein
MPEQPVLAVFRTERFLQQRIVAQVEHARAKIIAGAPIGVDIVELTGRKRLLG